MRLSYTLTSYFGRHFVFWLFSVFVAVLAIIELFDFVELLRRSSGKKAVTLEHVVQMTLLKLPHLIHEVLPFIILFAAMLSFWRLARTNELVVARTAGISVWQFLLPALAISMVVGILQITTVNHFSSILLAKFERMESRLLRYKKDDFTVSPTGLWLRQGDADGQEVIHARTVEQNGAEISNVTVFFLDNAGLFTGRIDANHATLRDGFWEMRSVTMSWPDGRAEQAAVYNLETELTLERILEGFASPETMSFWSLPEFIENLELSGFNADRHRLHYYSLLAMPFLLCAMVLVAATFSLKATRQGATGKMVLFGVTCGFLLYFMTSVVHALGLSVSIPTVLAASMPAGVSLMLGITALLHLEDG